MGSWVESFFGGGGGEGGVTKSPDFRCLEVGAMV